MFGLDNSIEPAASARPAAARKPGPAEIPIREATPTEMRALRSQPAAHEAETDTIARRHNLYVAQRRSARIYYTDYQQKSEVMRARPQRITTKLDDRQTVSAMLDLAQERGWQSVKLRGSDSFKREAWVQAQVRGMQTEGYQPKATDKQEVERRAPNVLAQDKTPVLQPAKAQAKATTARPPVAKATKTAKPEKAAEAVSTTKPADEATKAAQQRQSAVWGAVEAAGQQAMQDDAAPAQKAAQKPATLSTAAAA